jgi:hypothetical protein
MHLVGYFHSCITLHGFVNVKCKLDFTLVHLQEINKAEGKYTDNSYYSCTPLYYWTILKMEASISSETSVNQLPIQIPFQMALTRSLSFRFHVCDFSLQQLPVTMC